MFYTLSTWLLIFLYRLIGPTLRLVNDPEPALQAIKRQGKNILFALWHESTFICFYYYRHRGASALFEASAKGDALAGLAKYFGFMGFRITEDVRSALSARGTIQFIKYLRAGHDGTVALDGPNGPYQVPKHGIMAIAEKSGNVILPVGVWYEKKFTCFWRWDKYQIPWPWSKAVLVTLPPLQSTDTLETLVERIAEAGHKAQELGLKTAK